MESLPVNKRGLWKREGDRVYLCGTLGIEFDQYQRRLSAVSAAEAYHAQLEGLRLVEELMDALENEARESLAPNEVLQARRSPGYGEMPLSLSREILAKLEATKRIGVALTDANLLVPTKSVTAICQITSST